MCAGSVIQARLSHLVWGAPDIRQGAHGSLINILDYPHPIHKVAVRSGICAEQSRTLLRSFFSLRRKEKSPSPRSKPLFEELITLQKNQLARLARELIPHLTDEDLLQPNDFPDLEHNPHFRYEEGHLAGLLSAQAAFLAQQQD